MGSVQARQVPAQSVSIFLLFKMAPRESDAVYTSFTPTLRVADKALDLPVVSDAVSEITKITAPIAPYFEEGIRIIKDKADESLSETIKDKVGSCVTSLDTLACDGLDQLISAVPSLRSATPDLVETTKETASNYVDMIEESEDSLEYRSETELEELEDCPTTPNCAKVEHKIIKKVPYEKESSSEADSEEEDVLCNTPLCAKVEHTKVADVEEIEELSDGETGLDEVDDEFEEISEVECRTPQCVKDEHEGRRFQQAESQSDSQEE